MLVNSCSTALLIVFSMFLLILIILCNFVLIFCKRLPCLVGDYENGIGRNNYPIVRVGNRCEHANSINMQELSEISPITKYSSITKKLGKTVNKYYSTSVFGSTSSNGTQRSKHCYTCAICLSNIGDDDLIRSLPCSHIYHYNCIDEWVKVKSSCPLCNVSLDTIFKDRNILGYKDHASSIQNNDEMHIYMV
ncbi:ring finger [Cryptosporidium bovis]|uniref:ring finger n=1 Tax=Cryptosporidium bovis TaxID=310047 RepID=UPI00351AA587|nr:ring finger [Cryptosporidium bovis]